MTKSSNKLMSETPSQGCLVKLKCLKTEMGIKGKLTLPKCVLREHGQRKNLLDEG